ncbi:MAG: serine hydrolase [Burkholderiaceae bacterium]|jgi:D-alanyl-D-alanine endopeptidase (penicillin-binding protein 7)|nr:serine hydrolase [Burkholderiaceae bacterium]
MLVVRFVCVFFAFVLCMQPVCAATQKTAGTRTDSGNVRKAGKKTAIPKGPAKKVKGAKSAKRAVPVRPADALAANALITVSRKLSTQPQKPVHVTVTAQRDSSNLVPVSFPDVSLQRASLPGTLAAGPHRLNRTPDPLSLSAAAAYVLDQSTLGVIFQKNASIPLPMASITKLMTALVVVEAMQDMSEILEITHEDVARAPSSRLSIGTRTTRGNLLHLALMSSENRAAATLGRNFPGGFSSFVTTMNIKARMLGMSKTQYIDTTGLSSNNLSSAEDLARLVMAAAQYPILREFSTDTGYVISDGHKQVQYANTNRLVHDPNLNIELQKTGFINAAGSCLVMQAIIDDRPVVMVFLDSKDKDSRAADVMKVYRWVRHSQRITTAQNKVGER